MFRLYFIDGLSDLESCRPDESDVPQKKKKKYTDESVKKRRQRFLKNLQMSPMSR